MEKIIVAALSKNNVLGRQGALPWSLPRDEAHLKDLIQDGWLLTGRTSFQSAQGDDLFADRSDVIILTRQQGFSALGRHVAHALHDAYAKARQAGADKLYILGGATVYQQTLGDADQLILTHVHATVKGDAYFPAIDAKDWQEVRREDHPADHQHTYAFSIVWYERPR